MGNALQLWKKRKGIASPFPRMGRLPLLISALMLLGLSGCHEKQKKTGPPQTVSVLKLEPQSVRVSRDYVGRTDALLSVDIRPQVSGYITGFFFHEGEFVHRGQRLFQINPLPYQVQVDSALAQLARADADIAQADAQLAKAEDAARRYAPLAGIDAIPRQQYADALAEVRVRSAEVLQMRANRSIAQASLEQARVRLSYTTLRSPISGIAGMRRLTTGGLASAEDPQPLTTISQADPIRVRFSIGDADYLRYIAPPETQGSARHPRTDGLQGKNAINPVRDIDFKLQLADGSTYGQRGRFYGVSRAADTSTDTVEMALLYPNPDYRLRPGEYARVHSNVERRENVLLVPVNAVQELQGARLVWVLGPDNQAKQRNVKAEQRTGNTYIVTDGLKPGDEVIVGGEQKLRPGDKVKPHPVTFAQLEENSSDAEVGNGSTNTSSSGAQGHP